jgi:cyanophycinase
MNLVARSHRRLFPWFVLLISLSCAATVARGETVGGWFDPAGISGKLVIAGGGTVPEEAVEQFAEWAGDADARLVIIPTAGGKVEDPEHLQELVDWWREKTDIETIHVLHARTRDEADSGEFTTLLAQATAVWFSGGQQSRLAEAYLGTRVEQELTALLERGGVIGGTSAGAAIQSRVMIAGGNPQPKMAAGFDLLPGAIIDQHFQQRNRKPRLVAALRDHRGLFGVGIDEGTALLIDGRDIDIVGQGSATFLVAYGQEPELREWIGRHDDVADLTAWRRAARTALEDPFPPCEPAPAQLAAGSLVIVGGGGLPSELVTRFVELAGGPAAPLVILPTAMPDPLPDEDRMAATFRRAGAQQVTVLNARRRADVEAPEFLETLRQARGVWFGGGRQWRFVDAYEGTAAAPLLHDVLKRGGVIGGSSAGASIQAEYLVRGSPLRNTDMMAWGYERGLGFLPGVAVDQHFAQRNRFNDLLSVVQCYPQLLGIGIDEATAVIVQGQVAEIAGRGSAHFFDGRRIRELEDKPNNVVPPAEAVDNEQNSVAEQPAKNPPGSAKHGGEDEKPHPWQSVQSGGRYDLLRREAIESP